MINCLQPIIQHHHHHITNVYLPNAYQPVHLAPSTLLQNPLGYNPSQRVITQPVRQITNRQVINSPDNNSIKKHLDIVTDERKSREKFQTKVQDRLDKLFEKLDVMDKTLNEITDQFGKPKAKSQYVPPYKLKKSHLQSDQEQSTHLYDDGRGHLFSTPARDQSVPVKQGSVHEPKVPVFHELQMNEVLNSVSLEKGIRFGDYYYFGDTDAEGYREGYGAYYDWSGRIIYCGYWHKDKYHNRGKLYFYGDRFRKLDLNTFRNQEEVDGNKVSYTGQFWSGEIKGLGQMLFGQKDGNERFIYYGRFVDGIFHGRATLMSYQGDLEQDALGFQGEWSSGKLFQRGREYSSPRKDQH